jgi:ribonuclease HI
MHHEKEVIGKEKKPCYKSNNNGKDKGKMSCWTPDKRDGKHTCNPNSWVRPSEGWIKINVDGSFVERTETAGVGVIARNSEGAVVFMAWRALFRCADAAEAEARACVEGVRLATQLAQVPVIIESDCVRVVKAMKEKKDLSDLSFIFAEAFDHAQLLSSWRVVKVNKDFNQVANELAIFARRNSHTAVWVGQAPA